MIFSIVIKHRYIQIGKCSIHSLYHCTTTSQHLWIAFKLNQSKCCHNIGHVTLVPWTNNIVFPSTKFCFGKCILVLTMQTKQLAQTIQEFIPSLALNKWHRTSTVNLLSLHLFVTERKIPSDSTTFSRSKVLHCMERERTEIGNLSSHLTMPLATESMSAVSTNSYTT